MCWSLPVSAGMAVVGASGALIARRRNMPKTISVCLAYFAFMEALQAAGYLVINQCDAPSNKAITLLSFLHIVFQPLFVNALALELIPAEVRRRIRPAVFLLCGAASAFMLAQLLPIDALGQCDPGACLCGPTLCTRSGQWHLAWDVPYNALGVPFERLLGTRFGMPSYMLAAFVMPLFYGSWRFTLWHLLLGPVMANMLSSDNNETPAIWCLFSVGIVIIAFFPPMLEYFRVRSWPLWPARWTRAETTIPPAV